MNNNVQDDSQINNSIESLNSFLSSIKKRKEDDAKRAEAMKSRFDEIENENEDEDDDEYASNGAYEVETSKPINVDTSNISEEDSDFSEEELEDLF